MLIVALTGGIATGKSVVAQILENLGCYIHHADRVAHELMAPGKPAWKKIVARFGQEILNLDQTVDRAKLGKIIFSQERERVFLNNLIHPLVLEEKKKAIARLRKEGRKRIFVSEAALTVESGFVGFFDKVIVVYCDEEAQIRRLQERDSISREEAIKKIQVQMPSQEKMKYANYLIDTSGTIAGTIEQTERVFRQLIVDYELKYGKKGT